MASDGIKMRKQWRIMYVHALLLSFRAKSKFGTEQFYRCNSRFQQECTYAMVPQVSFVAVQQCKLLEETLVRRTVLETCSFTVFKAYIVKGTLFDH